MRVFCTRCKEYRGEGEEFGIHFWENFPMCDKCGAYVDLEDFGHGLTQTILLVPSGPMFTSKKSLKFLGAQIDSESFRNKVTMPKKRPFQDDKVTKEQIRRIVLGLKHLGLKTLLMLIKDTQARPREVLA